MFAFKTIASFSALLSLSLGAASGAFAQTGTRQVANAQAAASAWTCPFSVVEIAPVSHDTAGRPTEWVMVQRVKGEVVAAERVSEKEVAQIRAMPCDGAKPLSTQPLVG